MIANIRKIIFLGFILPGVMFSIKADEVTLRHHENSQLLLNADFTIARGNHTTDDVVLILHGALAHKHMETVAYINQLLIDKGYNTLAVNLSLGLSNRQGMYDCSTTHRHTNNDAVDEINQWVQWLAQRGVKNVFLLGHSRGGAQLTLFSRQYSSKHIKALALLAPATENNTNALAYQQRYQKRLAPILQQAHQKMAEGRRHAVLKNIGFMTCRNTTATVESFLSYYDNPNSVDTPSLLKNIQIPYVIVVAGDDQVVRNLDKKIQHLVNNKDKQLVVIDGAGHMFRDLNADEAIDSVHRFFHTVKTGQLSMNP